MNTNREAVYSLISLLVKKAGFDIDKNEAEKELNKTKESIEKLLREKAHSNDKKNLSRLIDNLRVRESFWENNAEVVGKSLIESYDEGKSYSSVKVRVEHLANLATKGTKDLEVSYIYSRLSELEKEYEDILNKIDNSDYINSEEKEMDIKYKTYLENKIDSLNNEIEDASKELDNLREVETKDVAIVNKLRDYNDGLNTNLKRLEDAAENSINTDIPFEVWEKLENAKNDISSKLEKSKDILEKTESMLNDVRKNRSSLNERKNVLEEDRRRCNTKLNNVNTKLEEEDYVNTTEKMMDISKSEMIRLEMESLRNKKDVIYVDSSKVKEELIKEWDSSKRDRVITKRVKDLEEKIESTSDNEEVTMEEVKIDSTPSIEKEERKNKFELDW